MAFLLFHVVSPDTHLFKKTSVNREILYLSCVCALDKLLKQSQVLLFCIISVHGMSYFMFISFVYTWFPLYMYLLIYSYVHCENIFLMRTLLFVQGMINLIYRTNLLKISVSSKILTGRYVNLFVNITRISMQTQAQHNPASLFVFHMFCLIITVSSQASQ